VLTANINAVRKAITVKRDMTDHSNANRPLRELIASPQRDVLAAMVVESSVLLRSGQRSSVDCSIWNEADFWKGSRIDREGECRKLMMEGKGTL
jgi:hypothetical protein